MPNRVANKIRLLLNELAILNQPEINSSGIVFSEDILSKIKQLSSELYINVDFAINHIELPAIDLVNQTPSNGLDSNKIVHDIPTELVVDNANNEIISISENIHVSEFDDALQVEPELVSMPIAESIVEIADEIETAPVISNEPEVSIEPAVEDKPIAETIASEQFNSPNIDIMSRFSLTRRFEYINNLFSGDADAFSQFLKNVTMYGNVTQAMDFFDVEFDKRNWKRKEESASEFRSIIRKAIQ